MRPTALCLFVLLAFSVTLQARPPYKQSLRRYYGEVLPQSMQACATCHFTKEQVDDPSAYDESAPEHNPFGARLAEVVAELPHTARFSDIPTGLNKLAQEDADGDGVSNEQEIVTGHSPGVATDKPTQEEIDGVATQLTELNRRRPRYDWQPFQSVRRPTVPAPIQSTASPNAIDAFLAVEHEARGLKPRPEAARAILLRRVSLDLIGLPPTRQELHDFLADESPGAYERVVDRLLASPHYGERWGRHWMDVWRYSDWAGWTDGKQIRDSQPHIWRWRDWIVESLNQDKPYDRMVAEMLAADEIAPADPDALRATGFLARNYKMLSRETWMQDTVNHTLQAFLGLTVACARCHDHMYDAISQAEYYRLRAIFEPHQVRLDQLPNEPNTTKDGLPRVFDENLAAITYLFRKGDDRDPDKEQPLAPGVLELLGDDDYRVIPVDLPPEAYYPARKPYIQKAIIAAAEAEVASAESALKQANEALTSAQKTAATAADAATADLARAKAGLASKIVAASQARLASTEARLAADDAKFANPTAGNANELARTASQAERDATFAQAEVDALKSEMTRIAALVAKKPGDEKSEQALVAADKLVAETRQKRDAASSARGEKTVEYSPLGKVYPKQSSGRRAALARWLTSRRNPLASRVAINQIWMRHFGQPLVPTVLDFGQNGQPPRLAALVDWLATEIMEPTASAVQPWSMKPIHRLIVTSQAYRRASTPDDNNLAVDPDNQWLWRMPSRRMEAELVRDGILYVAGQLDLTMGGPDIDHKQGLIAKRRSLYFQNAQEKQMDFLKMFDCAAVTECYQRKESIVPQQALAMANSDLTLVQARIIARRLHQSHSMDDSQFASAAFECVLSRPATTDELHATVAFISDQQRRLANAAFISRAEGDAARLAATSGETLSDATYSSRAERHAAQRAAESGETLSDATRAATDSRLRARENVMHVLLNHNDFVTIR